MANGNYYQGTSQKPYHLSVGVVLLNKDNEVACHYFTEAHEYTDFYILMRETMEAGESIEEALARGLAEEFGAKGKLLTFIGSRQSKFPGRSAIIYKTTLYFVFSMIEFNTANRKPDDEEKDSEILWLPIDTLIAKMQEQGKRFGQNALDLDESEVLERVNGLLPLLATVTNHHKFGTINL